MTEPLRTTSGEEVREALFSLRVEHDALVQSHAHAHAHAQQLLGGLEELLHMQPDDDPFSRVFTALRKVFTFTHAMLLAETAGTPHSVECIAADPATLVGTRWPTGPMFEKVMNGRASATFSHVDIAECAMRPRSACVRTSRPSTHRCVSASTAASS